MTKRGDVLVAIMNHPHDWHFAFDDHWYRIPVASVNRILKQRWPPRRLAFYQTKIFGDEAYAVRYYADVLGIEERARHQLMPNEPPNLKSNRKYYQLHLSPLMRLERPIVSARWRRLIFIPTTWDKFITATEINDLYDDSPLEDRLWASLKPHNLPIIRQEWVDIGPKPNRYALDFAIYCARSKLAIETDGDSWHHTPELAEKDNLRDNDLKADGWQVLHFNTRQIMEEASSYCIDTIFDTINAHGGVDEAYVPYNVDSNLDSPRQLGLFD